MRSQQAKSIHVGNPWRVVLRDLGLDEQAILVRAQQPRRLFEDPGTWINVQDYYALFDAVEAEADEPMVAITAGKVLSAELFHPAYFSALCSPNLNAALSRLSEFMRLVGPFALDVVVETEQTRVRYRCKHRPDIARAAGLAQLAFIVALGRRATRHEIVPRAVMVAAPTTNLDGCAEFFGVSLTEAPAWELTFSAYDAQRPFLTHNDAMWQTFAPDLRRRMSKSSVERSATESAEEALLELLPSGRSSITDVCKELGLASRTLQRRLAAEGVSWGKVLDDTRERLALHYLQSTDLSAREIGFLLGYQDPNSLYRAFHRWTGATPEMWRASRRPLN